MVRFILNNSEISSGLPAATVLLDVIRYHQNLKGTKIGCREGDCGACTILVGTKEDTGEMKYQSMTSCLMPLGNAHGKHIVTIEGINGDSLTPVQQFMAEEGATQCGFCTPGFVMSLTGFCVSANESSKGNIISAIDGNICRCTGYKSIERAAQKLDNLFSTPNQQKPLDLAIELGIVPGWFREIPGRISTIITNEDKVENVSNPIVGGGTDLYVQQHDSIQEKELHYFFGNKQLKQIEVKKSICSIGGSVTVTEMKESTIINDLFPYFNRYAKLVSSTPIRNMATIAGNFVNASPIGDLTILFLALNAQLTLSDGDTKRNVFLRDFYKGYKQLDKKPGEFIETISFEIPGEDEFIHFEKVSKRTHLDIASVNSAARMAIEGERIISCSLSAGGVGPVPMFLKNTSAYFEGKEISIEVIKEGLKAMQNEISPISDARGTEKYKRELLSRLIKAHFLELFSVHLDASSLISA